MNIPTQTIIAVVMAIPAVLSYGIFIGEMVEIHEGKRKKYSWWVVPLNLGYGLLYFVAMYWIG